LRAPWEAPLAWHLPTAERDGLTAPDAAFRDVASAYARDVTTERFAARALAPDASRAEVTYPSGETIEVRATGLDGHRFLVVNENWDSAWRAAADGRPLHTERFGPNLIGVDLTGVSGDATVYLTHQWPAAQLVGLLLSLVALPAGLLLAGRVGGMRD